MDCAQMKKELWAPAPDPILLPHFAHQENKFQRSLESSPRHVAEPEPESSSNVTTVPCDNASTGTSSTGIGGELQFIVSWQCSRNSF